MFNAYESEEHELHLFIVWNNGYEYLNRIIDDISDRFTIKANWIVEWNSNQFTKNLRRFYGRNLPNNSNKESDCGIGPFNVLIVQDNHPIYAPRRTNQGTQLVNINMFDSKEMYRTWAKRNVIHATNTPKEAEHDITLLFGVSPSDLAERSFDQPESSNHPGFDIVGSDGWQNLSQLFYVMNHTMNYVVLRNYESLPDHVQLGKHSDLDILVEDLDAAKWIINGQPTSSAKNRVQYRTKVEDSFINIDIRNVDDGYYDKAWEKNILTYRVYDNRGFYIPDKMNYLYTLVYHALMHKGSVSEDYIVRVKNLCKESGEMEFDLWNESVALKRLNAFMRKNGYKFTEPSDHSVTYNFSKVNGGASLVRKKQLLIRKLKKAGKKLLGK